MKRRHSLDDEAFLDWAEQERLARQDVDEIEQKMKKRKAENYRKEEIDGRVNTEG